MPKKLREVIVFKYQKKEGSAFYESVEDGLKYQQCMKMICWNQQLMLNMMHGIKIPALLMG